MKKTIVIMAAGMGSRYGGLKQIDPMGPSGEILMEYSVYDAIGAGFDKVIFIIKESIEAEFHERIGKRLESKIDVEYAFQSLEDLPESFSVPEGRTKPWGTTHAILAARDLIKTPFAVFNADDFYGREAFVKMSDFLDHMDQGGGQAAMVGYKIKNTLSPHGSVTRGICQVDDSYLSAVKEISKIEWGTNETIQFQDEDSVQTLQGDELCSMNFWGFAPKIMESLKNDFQHFLEEKIDVPKSECLVPTSVDNLIKKGSLKVSVLESNDSWFGVTYPEDKPQVVGRIHSMVDASQYPSPLFPQS